MSPSPRRAERWRSDTVPGLGLAVALLLPVLGLLIPLVTGWDTASRAARSAAAHATPPLHGFLEVTWFGPGTLPAVAIAVLGWRYAVDLAERLTWRRLLATAYVVSLAWLLALALVTGTDGVAGIISGHYEYLPTVRAVGHSPGDVHHLLQTYIGRISYDVYPRNWPTQVAGHPPGMILFFIALAAVGLGGDLASGLAVIVVAASIAVAVLVTLRALGAEAMARRAAPFLVLTPSAVFLAVSGEAVISAVVAWGLACLALGATSARRGRSARAMVGWSALAGLLLGYAVFMSYGMPLMGLVALAVLVAARRWQPLPVAVVTALVVVVVFAALGFAWWEAYPVLNERYHAGVAQHRPYLYWVWANFGALAVSAGPLLGAGLACAGAAGSARVRAWRQARRTGVVSTAAAPTPDDRGRRVVLLLVGAAALVVALADLSGMSKAEVERIWLPFMPWLTLSCALLPDRWRRPGIAVQVVTALLVEHLLHTAW